MFSINLNKSNVFNIEDRTDLSQMYDESPEKVLDKTAEQFVDKIAWRIYTEFCCSNHWDKHRDYAGEGYEQWVSDEIYYEMERRMKKMSPEEIAKLNPDQFYAEVRIDVLRAVTARSIELFSQWNGNTYPPDINNTNKNSTNRDTRNLRVSLEPYIKRGE